MSQEAATILISASHTFLCNLRHKCLLFPRQLASFLRGSVIRLLWRWKIVSPFRSAPFWLCWFTLPSWTLSSRIQRQRQNVFKHALDQPTRLVLVASLTLSPRSGKTDNLHQLASAVCQFGISFIQQRVASRSTYASQRPPSIKVNLDRQSCWHPQTYEILSRCVSLRL